MEKTQERNEIRISEKIVNSNRLLTEEEIEEEIEKQIAEFEEEIPVLLENPNEIFSNEDPENELEPLSISSSELETSEDFINQVKENSNYFGDKLSSIQQQNEEMSSEFHIKLNFPNSVAEETSFNTQSFIAINNSTTEKATDSIEVPQFSDAEKKAIFDIDHFKETRMREMENKAKEEEERKKKIESLIEQQRQKWKEQEELEFKRIEKEREIRKEARRLRVVEEEKRWRLAQEAILRLADMESLRSAQLMSLSQRQKETPKLKQKEKENTKSSSQIVNPPINPSPTPEVMIQPSVIDNSDNKIEIVNPLISTLPSPIVSPTTNSNLIQNVNQKHSLSQNEESQNKITDSEKQKEILPNKIENPQEVDEKIKNKATTELSLINENEKKRVIQEERNKDQLSELLAEKLKIEQAKLNHILEKQKEEEERIQKVEKERKLAEDILKKQQEELAFINSRNQKLLQIKKNTACRILLKFWRKFKSDQKKKRNEKAVILQKYWRGYSTRKKYKPLLIHLKIENERKNKAAIKIQKVWRGHHIYSQFKQILSTFLHPLDDISDIDLEELESWYTPPEDLLLFDLDLDSFPSSFSVHHTHSKPQSTNSIPSFIHHPISISNTPFIHQPISLSTNPPFIYQPAPPSEVVADLRSNQNDSHQSPSSKSTNQPSSLFNNPLPPSSTLNHNNVQEEDWNFTSQQTKEAFLRRQQKLEALDAYAVQKSQRLKQQAYPQKNGFVNETVKQQYNLPNHSNLTSSVTSLSLTVTSISEPSSRATSASQSLSLISNSTVTTPKNGHVSEPMLRTSSFDSLPNIVQARRVNRMHRRHVSSNTNQSVNQTNRQSSVLLNNYVSNTPPPAPNKNTKKEPLFPPIGNVKKTY